jgi:hypothetical protein
MHLCDLYFNFKYYYMECALEASGYKIGELKKNYIFAK